MPVMTDAGDASDSFSLGEIGALAVKAARGAGHPWGIAEEAGWAVRWLARRRLPGAEALARHLGAPDGGACPIVLGAYLADAGTLTDPALADVAEPLLLVPFLARAAPAGLRVAIGDHTFRVSAQGTDLTGPLPRRGPIDLRPDHTALEAPEPSHRVQAIAPEAFATLQALAARTYAPATDASRAKGAGAGLVDND